MHQQSTYFFSAICKVKIFAFLLIIIIIINMLFQRATSFLLTHPSSSSSSSFCALTTKSVLQRPTNHCFASVTGKIYSFSDEDDDDDDPKAPMVRLFTKEGCTLCDKVKDVLLELRPIQPHSLEQIDITDPNHEMWYEKYKYDIPVLHVSL
jgi:hypothetical protein